MSMQVLCSIFSLSQCRREPVHRITIGKHEGSWFLGDTIISPASYHVNRERMDRTTSLPQAWQGCMNPWLRRQYKVGDFDQMELPEWSGLIEVWAGDAMANDHLVQTEVIANLLCVLFKKSATDSYRSSSPPLPHNCRSPVDPRHSSTAV